MPLRQVRKPPIVRDGTDANDRPATAAEPPAGGAVAGWGGRLTVRGITHQRLGQTGLHYLALGQALAQVGAQAAQGGDAGDDAGLFGEGW